MKLLVIRRLKIENKILMQYFNEIERNFSQLEVEEARIDHFTVDLHEFYLLMLFRIA
jgi:hypothetical protein